MKNVSEDTVIDAFERCFCSDTKECPGCYQDGPGLGYECRNKLCKDVLAILKRYNMESCMNNKNRYPEELITNLANEKMRDFVLMVCTPNQLRTLIGLEKETCKSDGVENDQIGQYQKEISPNA